jgi:hypothetical protein
MYYRNLVVVQSLAEDDMRFVIVLALATTALVVSPLTTIANAFGHCPAKCAFLCKKNKPNDPSCQARCEQKLCNL